MRLGLSVWATVAATLFVLSSVQAAELSPRLKELLREAQDFQDRGEYAQA